MVAGLRHLPERCFARVITDSAYVVNSLLSGDAERWQRDGWQTKGKGVANADLWAAILGELRRHVVKVEKVQGHAGDSLNERCDRLAVAAREAIARR